MRLRVFTRLLAAAGTVLLAASTTTAFAQATTDVAVTLTAPSASKLLSLGTARTYTIQVANNGPSYVTSFQVDATFTVTAPYTVKASPSGCAKPTGQTAPFPCTVTLSGPLVSGASTTMNIAVTVSPPDPLPTAAADCPSGTVGDHDVTANISVPHIYQTQVTGGTPAEVEITDTDTANNAIPADTMRAVATWTDLAITNASSPATASEGGTVHYSVTVHNYGPCDVTGVFSDFYQTGTMNFASASGCANDASFASDGGCDLGNLALGADATYTADFTVASFPSSVTSAALPVSTDVYANEDVVNAAGHDSAVDFDNITTIDLSGNGGCSTGGAGTLLALLPLIGLQLRRRRAS